MVVNRQTLRLSLLPLRRSRSVMYLRTRMPISTRTQINPLHISVGIRPLNHTRILIKRQVLMAQYLVRRPKHMHSRTKLLRKSRIPRRPFRPGFRR